jgi:hypothetical protein
VRRAILLASSLMSLLACQSLTSLSDLGFQSTRVDAGLDAAVQPMDAAPPPVDAEPAIRTDATPACLVAEGAQCDPVKQCGCQPGRHCQTRTSFLRPMCVEPGSNAPWSGCRLERDCPAGQTCDRGSCRSYCQHDADCDHGRCVALAGSGPAADSGIGVCWRQCQAGQKDACASGTACRAVKTPDGQSGSYCVAPDDPCPTEEDGICDDSTGSGKCADGTDRKDCDCTPTLTGSHCDPVGQCGCAKGLTCDLQSLDTDLSDDNVITLSSDCINPGKKALYAECSEPEECALGLTCNLNLHLCVNLCSSDADCVGGGCMLIPNKDDSHLGMCTPHCDRTTNAPCTKGTTCATWNDDWEFTFRTPGDYCALPVQHDCPSGNGCDEPQGSAICAAGTDTKDCCSPAPINGECNHVTGCGCDTKPDTQCRHTPFTNVTTCMPKGNDPPWSLCTGAGDNCPPGYACGEGVCRKYCSSSKDCAGPNDICVAFADFLGDSIAGIGGCFSACDFGVEGTCPAGLTCAQTSPPEAYCLVPYSSCPDVYLDNGRCDDPRGTQVCAMGTDPECDSSQ